MTSTRPDGSVRKEHRVRPGYTPPTESLAYIPPMLRRPAEARIIKFEDIPPTDYYRYRYVLIEDHYVIVPVE